MRQVCVRKASHSKPQAFGWPICFSGNDVVFPVHPCLSLSSTELPARRCSYRELPISKLHPCRALRKHLHCIRYPDLLPLKLNVNSLCCAIYPTSTCLATFMPSMLYETFLNIGNIPSGFGRQLIPDYKHHRQNHDGCRWQVSRYFLKGVYLHAAMYVGAIKLRSSLCSR